MIDATGKPNIPSRFEQQADLGNNAKQAHAVSREDSGRAYTRLKRATGLFAAGLLAADGACAQALTPASPRIAGLALSKRSLLDACAPYQTGAGSVNTTWLQSAGPYVNAVASGASWVPQNAGACAPPYTVNLPYTFEATPDTLLGSGFSNAGTLDAPTQAIVLNDFDDITASVGLTFSPYDNATMEWPSLVVLRNTDANTSVGHWEAESPGYVDGVTSHLIYTEPAGTNDSVERLAGLGFALGLKSIGAPGLGGYGLPVGNFGDTTLSSVTASKANPCWPATRMGPLDLAFLAARHGLSPLFSELDAIKLDATYGTGGLLLDPAGFTTLALSHPGQVTISLADDGSTATRIGDSVILLAPGSQASSADASATHGAWIIGNHGVNTMVGSDYDDFFSPGPNATTITTGLGADSLLVSDITLSKITVLDFDPQHDTIWLTPNAAAVGSPAAQISIKESPLGATVQTVNGATINLSNVTTASLPNAESWIFSGLPTGLAPFQFDLCQGAGASGAPAPAPSASASAPLTAAGPAMAATPVPSPASNGPASAPSSAAGPNAALAPAFIADATSQVPPQPSTQSASNAGVIAGATLGACAGVALLGTGAWFYRRRRGGARFVAQSHNRFERFAPAQPNGSEMLPAGFGVRQPSPFMA